VDVFGIADVSGDDHRGARGFLQREGLGLADLGAHAAVWRDLHEQERNIAEAEGAVPRAAPVGDHGGKQGLVLFGAIAVGFALVPDDPFDWHPLQGGEHRVV
jgi:hypothetical protein